MDFVKSTPNPDWPLWNWWVTTVIRPPFMKGAVRADEETLFRGRCLSKGITNVGAMNNVVLDGAYSIKEARACVVNTVGISVV